MPERVVLTKWFVGRDSEGYKAREIKVFQRKDGFYQAANEPDNPRYVGGRYLLDINALDDTAQQAWLRLARDLERRLASNARERDRLQSELDEAKAKAGQGG